MQFTQVLSKTFTCSTVRMSINKCSKIWSLCSTVPPPPGLRCSVVDKNRTSSSSSSVTRALPSIPSVPWLFQVRCAQWWYVCSSVPFGYPFREPSCVKPSLQRTLSTWSSELWNETFVPGTLLRKKESSFLSSAILLDRATLRKASSTVVQKNVRVTKDRTQCYGSKEGLCLECGSHDKQLLCYHARFLASSFLEGSEKFTWKCHFNIKISLFLPEGRVFSYRFTSINKFKKRERELLLLIYLWM